MNFDKTAKFYFDLQSRIRRRRRGGSDTLIMG